MPDARRRLNNPQGHSRGGYDFFCLIWLIGLFAVECPYGSGPCGIGWGAPYDVDVHLPDLIADAGDVEFVWLEMVGKELAHLADGLGDFVVGFRGQLVEVFCAFHFWHEDDPREKGAVLQEHAAAAEGADFKTARCQPWMKLKCHGAMKYGLRAAVTGGDGNFLQLVNPAGLLLLRGNPAIAGSAPVDSVTFYDKTCHAGR